MQLAFSAAEVVQASTPAPSAGVRGKTDLLIRSFNEAVMNLEEEQFEAWQNELDLLWKAASGGDCTYASGEAKDRDQQRQKGAQTREMNTRIDALSNRSEINDVLRELLRELGQLKPEHKRHVIAKIKIYLDGFLLTALDEIHFDEDGGTMLLFQGHPASPTSDVDRFPRTGGSVVLHYRLRRAISLAHLHDVIAEWRKLNVRVVSVRREDGRWVNIPLDNNKGIKQCVLKMRLKAGYPGAELVNLSAYVDVPYSENDPQAEELSDEFEKPLARLFVFATADEMSTFGKALAPATPGACNLWRWDEAWGTDRAHTPHATHALIPSGNVVTFPGTGNVSEGTWAAMQVASVVEEPVGELHMDTPPLGVSADRHDRLKRGQVVLRYNVRSLDLHNLEDVVKHWRTLNIRAVHVRDKDGAWHCLPSDTGGDLNTTRVAWPHVNSPSSGSRGPSAVHRAECYRTEPHAGGVNLIAYANAPWAKDDPWVAVLSRAFVLACAPLLKAHDAQDFLHAPTQQLLDLEAQLQEAQDQETAKLAGRETAEQVVERAKVVSRVLGDRQWPEMASAHAAATSQQHMRKGFANKEDDGNIFITFEEKADPNLHANVSEAGNEKDALLRRIGILAVAHRTNDRWTTRSLSSCVSANLLHEYIEKNNVRATDANLIICVESLDRDVDAWRVPIMMALALPNNVGIDESVNAWWLVLVAIAKGPVSHADRTEASPSELEVGDVPVPAAGSQGERESAKPSPHSRHALAQPQRLLDGRPALSFTLGAGSALLDDAKRSTAVDVLVFVSTRRGDPLLTMAEQETRALNESCASKGRSFHHGHGNLGELTDLLAELSPRVLVLLAHEEGGLAKAVLGVVAQHDATTRPRLVIANIPDSVQLCIDLARAGVHAMGWSTRYEAAAAMSFSVGVVEALLAAAGDACAAPSRPALRLAFAQGKTRVQATAPGGQGSAAIADPAEAEKLPDGKAAVGIPLLMLAPLSVEQIVGHLPPLPRFYVPRPEVHEALCAQLLADGIQAVAITPEARGIVISSPENSAVAVGSPAGAGKSTQAVAVARDSVVQSHFDQLVWHVIGEERSGTDVLRDLAELIVPEEQLKKIERGRTAADVARDLTAAISKKLAGKRTLIVSDGVWKTEQAEAVHHLKAEGGALVRLYTMRNHGIAHSYAPQHSSALPLMEGEQAKQLFRSHAGLAKGGCPEEETLLRHCSGLPISIMAVATLCRVKGSEWALGYLEEHLIKQVVPGYGTLHVALQGTLLHVAQEDEQLDEQCLMLAVFSADARVSLAEVGKLWGIAAKEEVKRRAAGLADWNLVAYHHEDETLALIDMYRTAYATLAGEQRMRGWHDALLRACEARVIPAPSGYWSHRRHVEHHLLEWGGKLSELDGGLGLVRALDLQGCKRLLSLDLPASLTHIGDWAFDSCSGLTSVVLPASLTRIGDRAFSSCSGLTSVELPASLTHIGTGAFFSCCGLTSVALPASLTNIGDGAFASCSGLTSVELPASLTHIGDEAFSSCSGLTSVKLPASLTHIGNRAFDSCSGLTSVELPASLKHIGCGAFSSCSGLTSVELPASLTRIGDRAFSSCSGLTSVELPASLTHVGDRAFSSCCGLTSVALPASLTHIGDGAFASCSGLTSVALPASLTHVGDRAFDSCSGLTSVELPASLTHIGAGAFASCSGLTSVELPASLTHIGDRAFDSCSGLTSVVLPASLTRIGTGAFDSCCGLTSVALPASLTRIGDYAFDSCSGLTSVELPASLTHVGDRAFSSCSGLTSVELPASLTHIGDRAFSSCSGLTSVELPASLTHIGDRAFDSCSGLTSVELPASLTHIGAGAFASCSGLTSVELPASLTHIGDRAFDSCSGLTSVELPASLTHIGNRAFSSCSGLTSVELPASLTYIGDAAFSSCSGLTSVELPASLTNIGHGAFSSCTGLTSVELPASLTHIGDRAFASCSGLTSIELPASLTYIGADSCSGLTSVALPASLTRIGDYAFASCSSLTSVALPASLTHIGRGAFDSCSGLTAVELPASLKHIGRQAFSSCSGLTSVALPASLTHIGDGAFSRCSGLTSVELPASLMHIGDRAFSRCSGLTSVELPASLTHIGDGAFDSCSGLTSVKLPASLKHIGDYAFIRCSGLTSVELPASLEHIGDYAFSRCSRLKSVELPASLQRIGRGAFDRTS